MAAIMAVERRGVNVVVLDVRDVPAIDATGLDQAIVRARRHAGLFGAPAAGAAPPHA
jgi:hypothetical protein